MDGNIFSFAYTDPCFSGDKTLWMGCLFFKNNNRSIRVTDSDTDGQQRLAALVPNNREQTLFALGTWIYFILLCPRSYHEQIILLYIANEDTFNPCPALLLI